MKENISKFAQRVLASSLFAIGMIITLEMHATAQLIGVYNMLTKASNAPGRTEPSVRLKATRDTITGRPWIGPVLTLPVEIELQFESKNLDEQGNPQPYVIRLCEYSRSDKAPCNKCPTSCPSDKLCVIGEVYVKKSGDLVNANPGAKQGTCISTSVFFLQKGDKVAQWQNVMLFLADQDTSGTNKLPFKWGLAAWTSTNGIWQNDFIDQAPQDTMSKAPAIKFAKKPTMFRGQEKELGLRVFQGQQAWGGGPLPRLTFIHIAHIYNNTQYPIMVRRTAVNKDLANYNFDKTIPPRSVMPFALVWLPKLTPAEADMQRTDPLKFYVLKIAKKGALPPAFNAITNVEGQQVDTDISDADIDATLTNITENMSPDAQGLSGYDKIIDELKRDPSEIYLRGKNFYKMFTTFTGLDKPQTVVLKRCFADSTEEDDMKKLSNTAYKGVAPKYLRMVINEAKDGSNGDLIDFQIDNVSEEAVFAKAAAYSESQDAGAYK